MKKRYLFFLLIAIAAFSVHAQTISVYKDLPVKKIYRVELNSEIRNGTEIYKVNGKQVSKAVYQKYQDTWKNIGACTPCILQTLSEEEILLTESVSYTDCPVGWYKEYYRNGKLKVQGYHKENPTGNWKDIYERGYCGVRDSVWTYFGPGGDTLYQEFWDNGKFLRQVPEQDSCEIWKTEFRFEGKPLAELKKIPADQLNKLEIIPYYKNSLHDSANIRIELQVVRIGNKFIRETYTLEKFSKLDLKALLKKNGFKDFSATSCTLMVLYKGHSVGYCSPKLDF